MINLSPNPSFFQTPDFSKIIEGIKAILKLIFGEQIPTWILTVAGYVLLVALILVALLGLLITVVKIKDLLTNSVWPIFYNKEKSRRSNRRRKFADHIESELRRLNNLEAWSDYRFTELEAEVDAEGRRRLFGILPSFYRTGSTLRREKSLSKALKSSDERLIIVEGEPGSGKSVALRHVASLLAVGAMRSRSTKSVIPIYVNLKEIERKRGEVVDRNLIESFVLKVLNRVNDRDVEEFLDEEFSEGLQTGTWFFLFDSFDEIPEVLSSTEADKTIRDYATAISDFLHGLNECRGVIASRFFHGPKQFGWPRFSILPLTSTRKLELIRKANLNIAAEGELIGQLETAPQEISSMASNPMFLGLLCEHMRAGYPFPENSHTVLETYIESRLNRDKDRVYKRFKLDPQELRAAAEAAAFCMAADTGLGLSPKREDIRVAAQTLDIKLAKHFEKALDALTYLKLARADTSTTTDKSEQFTFSHRRFQEYFSTAVVLREPHRITAPQLLLDARWRETAVVMCQTHDSQALASLIEEAEISIARFADALKTYSPEQSGVGNNDRSVVNSKQNVTVHDRFQWPRHCLHLLGLIQDGFARRLNLLSDEMRTRIGEILTTATKEGIGADAKWALDVSASAAPIVFTELLRRAFSNRSQVVRDSAYRQVAKLNEIPADLALDIRITLCLMMLAGRLRKERRATHAHLSRLKDSSNFLATLRLLIWLPFLDSVFHAVIGGVIIVRATYDLQFVAHSDPLITLLPLFCAFAVVLSYITFYWPTTALDSIINFRLKKKQTDEPRLNDVFVLLGTSIRMPTFLLFASLPFIFILFLATGDTTTSEHYFEALRGYILLAPVWFFFGMWAPSALVFAIEGRFLNPLLWLVFPILGLGRFIKEIVLSLVSSFRQWKRTLVIIIVLFVSYSFFGLMAYGLYLLRHYKLVGLIVISILGLLAAVLGLSVLFSDLIRWRRWRTLHRSGLTAEEFVILVRSYHFQRYRIRFINEVRTKGLIVSSGDTEKVIYSFAKELEAPPHAEKDARSFTARIGRMASRFNELITKNDNRQSDQLQNKTNYLYGVAVSDEILKLLEQIRTIV